MDPNIQPSNHQQTGALVLPDDTGNGEPVLPNLRAILDRQAPPEVELTSDQLQQIEKALTHEYQQQQFQFQLLQLQRHQQQQKEQMLQQQQQAMLFGFRSQLITPFHVDKMRAPSMMLSPHHDYPLYNRTEYVPPTALMSSAFDFGDNNVEDQQYVDVNLISPRNTEPINAIAKALTPRTIREETEAKIAAQVKITKNHFFPKSDDEGDDDASDEEDSGFTPVPSIGATPSIDSEHNSPSMLRIQQRLTLESTPFERLPPPLLPLGDAAASRSTMVMTMMMIEEEEEMKKKMKKKKKTKKPRRHTKNQRKNRDIPEQQRRKTKKPLPLSLSPSLPVMEPRVIFDKAIGKEMFECPYENCDQRVSTRFSLKRHLKRHTGEKPFACDHPDCNKRFAEKSTLKRHLRIHTGQRPFVCSFEGCSKRFADLANIKRHIVLHQRDKDKVGGRPQRRGPRAKSTSISDSDDDNDSE